MYLSRRSVVLGEPCPQTDPPSDVTAVVAFLEASVKAEGYASQGAALTETASKAALKTAPSTASSATADFKGRDGKCLAALESVSVLMI